MLSKEGELVFQSFNYICCINPLLFWFVLFSPSRCMYTHRFLSTTSGCWRRRVVAGVVRWKWSWLVVHSWVVMGCIEEKLLFCLILLVTDVLDYREVEGRGGMFTMVVASYFGLVYRVVGCWVRWRDRRGWWWGFGCWVVIDVLMVNNVVKELMDVLARHLWWWCLWGRYFQLWRTIEGHGDYGHQVIIVRGRIFFYAWVCVSRRELSFFFCIFLLVFFFFL